MVKHFIKHLHLPLNFQTMKEAIKITRRSIHAFTNNYPAFSSAAFFLLPVSASTFFSGAFTPPPVLHELSDRLLLLSGVDTFSATSKFFTPLSLKLNMSIYSFICTLPFKLTFLLFAKASIAQMLSCNTCRRLVTLPSISSTMSLYRPLLHTHLLNIFFMLTASACALTLVFLSYCVSNAVGISSNTCIFAIAASGGALCSLAVAYTTAVGNVAAVVAAVEGRGGCVALLEAFKLIKGRATEAVAVAVPVNIGIVGVEALFRHRIPGRCGGAGEALLICYMGSILIVLDIVSSCMFYDSCKLLECEQRSRGCSSSLAYDSQCVCRGSSNELMDIL